MYQYNGTMINWHILIYFQAKYISILEQMYKMMQILYIDIFWHIDNLNISIFNQMYQYDAKYMIFCDPQKDKLIYYDKLTNQIYQYWSKYINMMQQC